MQKNFKPHPNSFKNTFCAFKEVLPNEIEGLKKQFESKAGSSYYYTEAGMYRVSNHWGRLANSKWRLIAREPETESKTKIGFAKWEEFYPDNVEEKLYYIKADFEKNLANYEHKNNPEYDGKPLLRTSFETTKRLKQIRNLQQLTSWAKHFDYDDIDELRKQIINELIFTEKTLEQIKREIYGT
ncbi:hypothetical protein ASE40_06785 [Flavobacterium sp. Root935]|uniref:hypothetical protein n=1 Tax=Flavobacterium sp. Root935 TaxID=1736610 RepID=UPI00070C3F25|nr:hypothetical protein [Flavobacterium sp. Root935]KRD61248.1 hypothetical protein ASE40_06785 [Flavobacterium sp. Root935]